MKQSMKQIISDLVASVAFLLCLVLVFMEWAWLEACYA